MTHTVTMNGNGKRSPSDYRNRARNDRRKKACLGKYAWDDPFAALREMFALPYRTPELSEYDLSLYRCEFCDYWHLGKIVRMWEQIEPSDVPFQMSGQGMIPYPELKDYNPAGFRNTRRNGDPYE